MALLYDGNGEVIDVVLLPDGRIFNGRTMDQVLGVRALAYGADHMALVYQRLTGFQMDESAIRYYAGAEMRAQVYVWLDDPGMYGEVDNG